jgi:hypothetical protein
MTTYEVPGLTPAEMAKFRQSFHDAVWDIVAENFEDVRVDIACLSDRLDAVTRRIAALERAQAAQLTPDAIREIAFAQADAALNTACGCKEASHGTPA